MQRPTLCFFYPLFPFFFSPCLLLCLCLFPSSHSIFILYIPPCRRAAFMLPSSWILSYIFNSLSELIFSVSVYPFAFLSHCAIADTVFFQLSILQKVEECMCVCVCVCICMCENVYIRAYICVSVCALVKQWLNSLSFVFLARLGGVWQWTKCQCVRVEWKPAPSVIACPRSDTLESMAGDSGWLSGWCGWNQTL